ncbi:MAG: ABC transporter ATP-binding protein/permease [Oscillospiraceae bacterium]|jgi:ABC-type transport system involved in cytochrome bd biosynthesis fused ATPase/permease subunit|nr:ABC transporter ATP-binding protein/permease [Oscillospiraceae bacterium]
MKTISKLIAFVKPLGGVMSLAVLLGVLGNLSSIFIPLLGCFAILGAAGFAAPLGLGMSALIAAAVICGVLRGAFRYGEQTCNHFIAFRLLALIRERVFEALRRLCPAKLEGRERGNLITILTGDIELLEVFYAHTISPVAIAAIVSIFMTVFVGLYHPLYALIAALGYITVGAALPALGARAAGSGNARLREETGKFSSFYFDSLRGLYELARFGRGGERKSQIGDKTDELDGIRRSLNGREGALSALSGLCVTFFALVTLAAAFALRRAGAVELPGVLIPTVAVFSSFGPTLALANLGAGLQPTLSAGRRVLALLDETPETEDVIDGKAPDFTGAHSEKLTFSYGGEDVLRDLTLDIPKGRITGVTGKSGSGKSTFLKLLMRFWDAPPGSLFISDARVSEITTAHLRRLEGFVTQDTELFHDTIEANIKLGRPDASREDVVAAAKKASAHEFISRLPNGYETQIGELGSTLSGGERQRIGLARAFLHDAPLMLLDEPTSNLDSLNEGVILKALRGEARGRTVILVSHRASTMAAADRTYSVEKR